MILTVHIPRFPLLVALRASDRSQDLPIALGPQPGDPQLIGLCTPAAEESGVHPGLRIGEALARRPDLELLVADPGGTLEASEQVTERLEAIGAQVDQLDAATGVWRFDITGLQRLHGGPTGVLRRVRGALPIGMDARVGLAPTPFASLQAARHASTRVPLVLQQDEVAGFLAPLPVEALPLDRSAITALQHLGITTLGRLAGLSRADVIDRFGLDGLRAWNCARGVDGERLRPRRPPDPLEAAFHFPEPVGALPALHAAAGLLLSELAGAARNRGTALRSVTIRAWLEGGGSWTRTITLREATTQIDRLTVATLPSLAEVTGPVDTLVLRADASGRLAGHQMAITDPAERERTRRTGEAVRQVRSAHGDESVLRAVELEPWSRLPERRWALVPYDASISPVPST